MLIAGMWLQALLAKIARWLRPEGLLYAALRMAPAIGGGVASFDAAKVMALPGVHGVVDLSGVLPAHAGAGAGVAVVADSWWRAREVSSKAWGMSWPRRRRREPCSGCIPDS